MAACTTRGGLRWLCDCTSDNEHRQELSKLDDSDCQVWVCSTMRALGKFPWSVRCQRKKSRGKHSVPALDLRLNSQRPPKIDDGEGMPGLGVP